MLMASSGRAMHSTIDLEAADWADPRNPYINSFSAGFSIELDVDISLDGIVELDWNWPRHVDTVTIPLRSKDNVCGNSFAWKISKLFKFLTVRAQSFLITGNEPGIPNPV